MAKIDTSGIDGFEEKFRQVAVSDRREMMEKILNAGADVYIESWKGSIEAHGHVRSRSMLESVGKIMHEKKSEPNSIVIYSMGFDDHGVRNATKAYVINYGKGGKKTEHTGDKFVREAEKNAKDRADAAMQAALDDYLEKKGMT